MYGTCETLCRALAAKYPGDTPLMLVIWSPEEIQALADGMDISLSDHEIRAVLARLEDIPEDQRSDCSPPCRARLPTSQATTDCATDLRWPPWAETTSPAAFSSSIPFCRMLSAALISRSCSAPHSGHRQMRL